MEKEGEEGEEREVKEAENVSEYRKQENLELRALAERGEAGAQLALARRLHEQRDCECWHWFVAAAYLGKEEARRDLYRLLLIPARAEGRNVSLLTEKVSLLEEHVRQYGFSPPENRDFLNSIDPQLSGEGRALRPGLLERLSGVKNAVERILA